MSGESRARTYMLDELGFATRRDGDDLRGSASVTPAMHVPGTTRLRTSVLAAWASLAPGGTLCSLGLRYVQPARVGPVVATARRIDGLAQVDLRDSGNGDRLSCTATARSWPSALAGLR